MYNTLISVIMPAYNAEKYIEESIKSVINQTYTNIELIIVNDCSKDKTQEIIDKWSKEDSRIKKYINEKNSGVAYTRNYGIQKSTGEWIAFLDSDDLWTKDKLQKQIELIVNNNMEPAIIYTASQFIDENGEKYNYIMNVPKNIEYKELLKQNVISCSSVLVKKEIIENTKMENDKAHEDFITWLKILKDYNICAYGIDEPLLIYRISRNSKSGNKFKAAKMTYMVYKHVGLNFFARIYYMCFYTIKSLKKYKKIYNN